jgi:Tol biopolymer transport system component
MYRVICASVLLALLLSASALPAAPLRPNGGYDGSWSPDGKKIIFTSGSPHTPANLWIIGADGTGAMRLTGYGAHEPRWLSSGKIIVFGSVRTGKQVYMTISADGDEGSEKPVATLPEGAMNPVWSPDGSYVAFAVAGRDAHTRDLHIMRSDGSDARVLTSNQWAREWNWSPDGQSLAFTTGLMCGANLWIAPTRGGDAKQVYSGYCGASSFAPDGKRLALAITDAKSGYRITIIDPDTDSRRDIPVGACDGRRLIWSPKGDTLFFTASGRWEPSIRSVSLDGKELKRLTPHGLSATSPSLSPDGKRLVFCGVTKDSYGDELFIAGSDGAGIKRLLPSEPSYWAPLWSPNGKMLAIQSDMDHFVGLFTTAADGRFTRAFQISDPLTASCAWDSDGRRLFLADSGAIRYLKITGSATAQRFGKFDTIMQSICVGPTSIYVAENGNSGAGISALTLDGSNKKTLTHGGISISGALKRATYSMPIVDGQPSVSPDGKLVAFIRSGQIWVVGCNGESARRITTENAGAATVLFSPVWSPDSKAILFQTETGNAIEARVVQVDSGSEQVVCSERIISEYGTYYSAITSRPIFTADGRNIIFTSIADGEPYIASIGLDGRNLKRLVAVSASFPSLDVSGSRLAYVSVDAGGNGSGKLLTPHLFLATITVH